MGKHSRSAIGTLVDRTSRSVRLIHLPHGHSADTFIDAISHVLAALPEAARRTLTWDQGSEMARHDVLAEHFGSDLAHRKIASSPEGQRSINTHTPRIWHAPRSYSTTGRARSSTGRHPTGSSRTGYPDHVRVLRGPDEFTAGEN